MIDCVQISVLGKYESCKGNENNVPLGQSIRTQLQEKTTPYKVLAKKWEVGGTYIFMIDNENMLCIVNYYNRFPFIEKPRLYFLSLACLKNWFQRQAQILFQSNVKIFSKHLNIDQF